jgi:hypothetical protein
MMGMSVVVSPVMVNLVYDSPVSFSVRATDIWS